jgi:hypothetical protein
MVHEQLNDDVAINRVTIYYVGNGLATLISWFWRCLVVNAKAHSQRGILPYYYKHPPAPWRRYLRIYCRKGQPHQKGSSTYFLVADDEKEIEGFVPWVFYRQKPDGEDSLPDITGVRLKNISRVADIPDEGERQAVEEYMKSGHVRDIEKLKTVHRFSRYFFATPLVGKNDTLWGVLILDSTITPLNDNPALKKALVSYSRGIESVLRALPY